MSKKDYYELLGVSKTAKADEIKKAYRKLSKEHHPDKGGDEEKFKEISEAYNVLSDDQKRKEYDMFGHSDGRQRGGNPFGGFNPFGNHNHQRQKFGSDIALTVKLTLEEIFTGVKKTYKYDRKVSCTDCNGNGGHSTSKCTVCNGSGATMHIINTPVGTIQQVMQCNACDGTGSSYSNDCKTCNGEGVVSKNETIEVEIPSGVLDGMTFVMNGKGQGIKGGTEGDLHIKIQELTHKLYSRSGSDLKMNLKLSYPQLILGDKVEIETIEGTKIRITIPEYSEVGSNLRIPFKGITMFQKEGRGDIIITLGVEIPKDLDDETKALIVDLKEKLTKKVETE